MLRETNDPDLAAMTKDELAESKDRQETIGKGTGSPARFLRIQMMTRTSSWKSVELPVGMKPASLRPTSIICTFTTRESRAGKVEVVDKNETEVGGFKEIALMITGR